MTPVNSGPTAPAVEGDSLPKQGDIIAGKYRVDRVLGRGGMGVVVAAEHTNLRQRVAVKFLLPEAVSRAGATERFLREARNAAKIQSEHVAKVSDIDTLESGAPYMVMEFLTGQDLHQLLKSGGRLAVEEAVDYVLQACEAIAEAHSLGIVHRDLKPANLFLTTRADGSALVKVLDFGLSKATRPDTNEALDQSLTAAGTLLGSPHYMAPEQVRRKAVDARTDIWALGVILYQLLTARRPFEDEAFGGLLILIGSEAPTPITTYRPDLPEGLIAVIMRCLEKEMSARPQTVAELARSLEPFGSASARISIERIHRVLSENASLPPPRGTLPSFDSGLRSSAPGTGSVSGRTNRGGDSTDAVASTLAEDASAPESRARAQRSEVSRRRAVPLVLGASIGIVLLGTATVLLLRPTAPANDAKAALVPPSAALAAAPASAAPTAVAPASAAAQVAPVLSASASATSPDPTASAPSASASAPASAVTSAVKATPQKGGKTGTKKNPSDPMDRWR